MVVTRWDMRAGKTGEETPVSGAVWRGYFECARRILEVYVSGFGLARIAKVMSEEGWAFRTHHGLPSPLETDDVRRVARNWIEYWGTVIGRSAKDRPAYAIKPNSIPINPERAVFDVELLRQVGQVATEKAYK